MGRDSERTERERGNLFSPLSRVRGRGDNCHIFLCLMVLARRTIVVTKYNILERCRQYQDHLRCLCPFLLPIFTHCMSLTYFNFSLPTEVKNHNTVLLCTNKSVQLTQRCHVNPCKRGKAEKWRRELVTTRENFWIQFQVQHNNRDSVDTMLPCTTLGSSSAMLTIVMDVKTMTQSVSHNSNFEKNSDTQ